jgi:hypothetical protein
LKYPRGGGIEPLAIWGKYEKEEVGKLKGKGREKGYKRNNGK